MARVDVCLETKIEDGSVDKRLGNNLLRDLRKRLKEIEDEEGLLRLEAELAESGALLDKEARKLVTKKRLAFKQNNILNDIRSHMQDVENRGFGVDHALMGRYSFDPRGRYRGPSVDLRIGSVRKEIHKRMAAFLQEFRTTHAGLGRKVDGLEEMMDERFGVNTGNENARALARSLDEATDYFIDRFNAAGGDIVRRKNWGWFQRHDPIKISRVAKDDWRAFVMERVNIEEMQAEAGRNFTPSQLWEMLGEVYDSVVSRGLNDVNSSISSRAFGSSVNSRANSRFLIFKGRKEWMEYHNTYGQGDLYDSIIHSTEQMAKDVASIEVLGPYPDATHSFMTKEWDKALARDAISKGGRAAMAAAGGVSGPKGGLTALRNVVLGRTAWTDHPNITAVSQANRNIVLSAVLGSATLSAIAGDIPLQALTARMNGIPANRVLSKHIKLFSPGNTRDRAMALRAGLGAQGWAARGISMQRIMGEVVGPEFTQKITDTLLRASGLTSWTESGQLAHGLGWMSWITENVETGVKWNDLNRFTRISLQGSGMTEEGWNVILNTKPWRDPETGATFIRTEDISNGEFEGIRFNAANQLVDTIERETQFAVPASNARVRAILSGGLHAGTVWGEVAANTSMLKSFLVSIHHLHWNRMLSERVQGPMSKAKYAAWMVLAMGSMGVLTQQMFEVANGRDPRNFADTQLWIDGLVRGGGMGYFGDLLFQDHRRFGGGLWEWALGPIASQVGDLYDLTVNNVRDLAEDKDTNFGREFVQFIKQNTPGRSLWYGRLAFERLIFDELLWMLDPKAHEYFNTIERKRRREDKQKYFSRPGRGLPERAPEFTKAFGS